MKKNKKTSHKRLYTDMHHNHLNLFDENKNNYHQLDTQKRKSVSPHKRIDKETTERYGCIPRKQSDYYIEPFECQIWRKPQNTGLPRQVSKVRDHISDEVNLAVRRRSVSPQLISDNVRELMTDDILPYQISQKRTLKQNRENQTPKFQQPRGIHIAPKGPTINPITQGVDYKDLNKQQMQHINKSTGKIISKQKPGFFEKGFEIFNENPIYKYRDTRAQRSESMWNIMIQNNNNQQDVKYRETRDFRGDQIYRILNDNSIPTPKKKEIKDFKSDIVPKIIRGETPLDTPKLKRVHHNDAWKSRLNIFRQFDIPHESTPVSRSVSPKLQRNYSANIKLVLDYQ